MFMRPTPSASKASGPQADEGYGIPSVFCWTKMGSEAGQVLADIIRRKDLERECGDGVFAWGIGNSVGPAIKHARCAERVSRLEALFTPMKSAPKTIDSSPRSVVMWMGYVANTGEAEMLPEHMLVTSRGHCESGGGKRGHYALICRSTSSIATQKFNEAIGRHSVCNLVSSNPVGASQVTSVVRYRSTALHDASYPVLFRAELTEQAFVRLAAPITLVGDLLEMYQTLCATQKPEEWRTGIKALKSAAASRASEVWQASFFT